MSRHPCSRAAPFLLAMFIGSAAALSAQSPCGHFRVLVFSKTSGYRHGAQISAGQSLFQNLAAANEFEVEFTEDDNAFQAANLNRFSVVVFLNTTGNVLNASQEAAFEDWSRAGGGFVGIHSATDTEYNWPFYGQLVGAYFQNHPSVQTATLRVRNGTHPATVHLPNSFSHQDEWYNFRTNPANDPDVDVLMTLDESTYSGGNMGPVHPISWTIERANQGRAFYTGLGHTTSTYAAPFFEQHLLGALRYVTGRAAPTAVCAGTSFGSGSGAVALLLDWSSASGGGAAVTTQGGTPLGTGLLVFSQCSANVASGPLTILIDLAPQQALLQLPVLFDANGEHRLPLPPTLPLPVSFGTSIHAQVAQFSPALALSNGITLDLCR